MSSPASFVANKFNQISNPFLDLAYKGTTTVYHLIEESTPMPKIFELEAVQILQNSTAAPWVQLGTAATLGGAAGILGAKALGQLRNRNIAKFAGQELIALLLTATGCLIANDKNAIGFVLGTTLLTTYTYAVRTLGVRNPGEENAIALANIKKVIAALTLKGLELTAALQQLGQLYGLNPPVPENLLEV